MVVKTRLFARSIWSDTTGVILPYVTIMLVVIVGMAVLALDGARYMSMQTQLQNGADALALAGAAELDRLTTSTTRAASAINNLVSNSTLFGTGGNATVTVSSIRFLSTLPASDATPITAVLCTNACTAAQSIAARFVEVTVQPVTMPAILPASFFGGANSLTVGASAVAGNDGVNCGLTPMFICNPFEQPGDTYDQATARLETANTTASFKRRLIKLADSGVSGTFGPGDFGYLVPEPGTLPSDSCFPGGQEIGKAMGMGRPLICVRQNGVDLQPGNTSAALDGLNTRFGKYPNGGSLSTNACKALYPPDVNVKTGFTGVDWCRVNPDGITTGSNVNWPPGPNYTALPADSCLLAGNSCSPIANLGADTWDCLSYWTAAHPGRTAPTGCTNSTNTLSRYDVYAYEINTPGALADASTATGETGAPQCTGTTPTANRRIFDVAIVNCGSSPVTVQSNAQNVPVAAFGRFFLTVAVPTAGPVKPYAEFRGLIQRGSGSAAGGVVYDQVQLYR